MKEQTKINLSIMLVMLASSAASSFTVSRNMEAIELNKETIKYQQLNLGVLQKRAEHNHQEIVRTLEHEIEALEREKVIRQAVLDIREDMAEAHPERGKRTATQGQ